MLPGNHGLAPDVGEQWRRRLDVDEAVPCERSRSATGIEVALMRLEEEGGKKELSLLVLPLTRVAARWCCH